MIFKNRKAFTLIELLVVIAIIGLLSSMAVYALNVARMKARDVKRKADLAQVQKALDLYYDANSAYPSSSGAWRSVCPTYGGYPTSGPNGYIPNLAPIYMGSLPADPLNCTRGDGYLYRSDGTQYKLLSHKSPEGSYPSAGEAFYDPVRPTWAWMICSTEPACGTW